MLKTHDYNDNAADCKGLSTHFLEKFPPCFRLVQNKGGTSHILENFQKSQVLECSEKLKNEVLSNLEGVDFWGPELKKFPLVLYQSETRGEIPQRLS